MKGRLSHGKIIKRTIVNKELWFSFVAIIRYFPTAIFARQIEGMSFYDPANQEEFRRRVASLQPDSPRAWGTMSTAQMIHHLNLALGGSLGFFSLPDESYWLSRTLFKWILVDFFPAQPKGLRMPLSFVIAPDEQFDFTKEKTLLQTILEKAWQTKTDDDWGRHPLMGRLTRRQWGKLAQIHVDYHLRQFSV